MTGPTVRLGTIGINVANLTRMAAFWQAITEYEPRPDGHDAVLVDPAGHGPNVRLVPTNEGPVGRHPVIELASANPAATSRLLLALGARVVEHREVGGEPITIFADPEGNRLVLLGAAAPTPQPGRLAGARTAGGAR